jgi:hypothetical protein
MCLSTRISVKKSAANNRKSDDAMTGAFCSGQVVDKVRGFRFSSFSQSLEPLDGTFEPAPQKG